MTVLMRDDLRLFAAMNEVLKLASNGGDDEETLKRSFVAAADGFGAERSVLLLVRQQHPLRLDVLHSRGLSEPQVAACATCESVAGVGGAAIRDAVESREVRLVRGALAGGEAPAESVSVICSPVLDPLHDFVSAVMCFQCATSDGTHACRDLAWLEGYAAAVGQTFSSYFDRQRSEHELAEIIGACERPENAPELVGDSSHTQALRRVLHEIYIPAAEASDPDPLLILGEKGTGKDLVARYLHACSARRKYPFVAVNCAEITDDMAAARMFGHKKGAFTGAITDEPGFFRAAHKGFLFLDEIGDLSPRSQASLLRVLENRTMVPVGETREIRVDVQVVLATNRDPEQAAHDGLIRADLLDRVKTQAMRLAPLRERPWDIPALVRHFITHHEKRLCKKSPGFTRDTMRAMLSYSWPGNVRELARICSLLMTHSRGGARIDAEFLEQRCPHLFGGTPNPRAAPILWEDVPLRQAIRAMEREMILSRLDRHHCNVRAARESLGLPKTTFQRYIASLGIDLPGQLRGRKLAES